MYSSFSLFDSFVNGVPLSSQGGGVGSVDSPSCLLAVLVVNCVVHASVRSPGVG
jgi:hypothetical protein